MSTLSHLALMLALKGATAMGITYGNIATIVMVVACELGDM